MNKILSLLMGVLLLFSCDSRRCSFEVTTDYSVIGENDTINISKIDTTETHRDASFYYSVIDDSSTLFINYHIGTDPNVLTVGQKRYKYPNLKVKVNNFSYRKIQ